MSADTGLLSLVWPGTGMDTLLADEAWVEAMLAVETEHGHEPGRTPGP